MHWCFVNVFGWKSSFSSTAGKPPILLLMAHPGGWSPRSLWRGHPEWGPGPGLTLLSLWQRPPRVSEPRSVVASGSFGFANHVSFLLVRFCFLSLLPVAFCLCLCLCLFVPVSFFPPPTFVLPRFPVVCILVSYIFLCYFLMFKCVSLTFFHHCSFPTGTGANG